ncbi:AraC family transcriptional regulator [Pendulispora brunnea]|uniref:AraC family transcriptional regulator n=1 Tax=Pendulispora brunnea TaxID=2905690 RepID=A0ABZ2KAD1_9BACT
MRAAAGEKSAALERAFGLPLDWREDQRLTVPLGVIRDLTESAEHLIADPHIGLRLGTSHKRGDFGIMEFAARSAPTFGAGIERLSKYQRLLNNFVSFESDVRKDEFVISHSIPGDPFGTGRHGHEYTMSVMLNMIRDVTQTPIVPKAVRFAHARSSGTLPLQEFFGTERVEFDQGINTLTFPIELVDLPLVTADAELLALLDGVAERDLQAAPFWGDDGERDWVISVRNHIVETLKRGETPSIEDAADAHHMSVRTLQRRLDEMGCIFAKLVDDVRRELSFIYLQDTRLRVRDVATRLGYAEVGPFVRAFRRWTGDTPRQYRARA